MEVQQLYMPGVVAMRERAERQTPDIESEEKTEHIQLWLPSMIPPHVPCDKRLRDIEFQLREAQAHDALNELRQALRLRAFLYMDKDRFKVGQRPNTRARSVIQRCDTRVDACATRYRVAHAALVALGPRLGKIGWEAQLRPLLASDVRGMTEAALGDTEGRRTLTWIWTSLGVGSGLTEEAGLEDGT